MILSGISVKRPVFALVMSLMLIIIGLVSFLRMSLREYPDIDPPIVTVDVTYPGASAEVIESQVTKIIEDKIAGIEGIEFIQSSSEDGRSKVSIEFSLSRDIESAANDIRDRISGSLDDFPDEADPPEIQKIDSNDDVIIWLNLTSPLMTIPELTDYANRYLVDRFSVIDGVGRVRIGGGQEYAMRIWLDREALAARDLTVRDVESALRSENVEMPAGNMESVMTQYTVRLQRAFREPKDFANLVLKKSNDGYLVRLGDVARVEKSSIEDRTFFRGNGVPMVGIGIIKQSTANTISVARAAKELAIEVNKNLPKQMKIEESYDSSVFIEEAINEVYSTLFIAIVLVIAVIYLFLKDVRAMFIPAITVPISLIATFIVLYALGYSINLFTLLALVLAIGMVVDDAIIVLENIARRIKEYNEPPLLAAYRGSQEVGLAVVATTLVLIAVFVPLAFLEGDLGRLFSEFSITMAVAVVFSSFVALTLSPVLSAALLKPNEEEDFEKKLNLFDKFLDKIYRIHRVLLEKSLQNKFVVVIVFFLVIISSLILFKIINFEYTPKEDRGSFIILVNGYEGATHKYMKDYINEIEARLMPYVNNGEISRLLVRTPRSFGSFSSFNTGMVICGLNLWSERRSAFLIINEIREKLSDITGVKIIPIMRQGFGAGNNKQFQYVIGGGTYQQLAKWRDIIVEKLAINNPGFVGLDWDYKETKPQVEVKVNYDLAAELGVEYSEVGSALETMLGSKRVTTYVEEGEEYYVILQGEREKNRDLNDLNNIYVRSSRTNKLIPLANIVELKQVASSASLNRYNRIRSITLDSNLNDDFNLGTALDYMDELVKKHLPETAIVDYKGQSKDLRESSQSIFFVFLLGIIITYLVLAAQFESFIHPFVILLSVPTAILGGLFGLLIMGSTLNLYSQIGLVMLVGLASKNGILIVEFANQLRDKGVPFHEAILEATTKRLRPILMTAITTAAGSLPLILSFGAGSETRYTIGVVVFFGVIFATVFTVFIVPVAYDLIARNTGSPEAVEQELERLMKGEKKG